jgi:light-regulated signal transduction histidine kinase (bacteriophytochrome)
MANNNDWTRFCESEPLAKSGAIQPHGGLLHLTDHALITHASANLASFFPCNPQTMPGEDLPAPLAAILHPTLTNLGQVPGSRVEVFDVHLSEQSSLDIVVSRSSEGIVLEFSEHAHRFIRTPAHSIPMRTPASAQEATELHQRIAALLNEVTGFDRVMIYVFREDGDGEVLAEARSAHVVGSYLGLRFPASDIPLIARNLYKKNPWRLIPDSQATSVPLISQNAPPPDLTWSDLRSVSPVHQSYLANMGVRASLSLPIMLGSQLWGLIACHHAESRVLPLKIMRTASQITHHYSLVISTWVAESKMRLVAKLDNHFLKMRNAIELQEDLLSAMPDIADILFGLFDATGMAIRLGNVWAHMGDSPNALTLEVLSTSFEQLPDESIVFTDSLVHRYPSLGEMPVAGALAIKMRTRKNQCLQIWLFRRELVQDVQWGGNPNKPVELQEGKLHVAPRQSFEKWVEKRKDYCSQWLPENHLAAKRLRQFLLKFLG